MCGCIRAATVDMIAIVLMLLIVSQLGTVTIKRDWSGPYFPPDLITSRSNNDIEMMMVSEECDNLSNNMDWDNSPLDYICFDNKSDYQPNIDVRPVLTTYPVPKGFHAQHMCTNRSINYTLDLPTFGHHRPVWARYGRYRYLPKQRWLHNLEHGAVVVLYHPCANQNEVQQLRNTVRHCIYRHVMTPSNLLTAEKPLALLAWGQKLTFSKYDEQLVKNFIHRYAHKGPENLKINGQFKEEFIEDTLLTINDDPQLCN